jgi:hypothetical protein
VKESFESRNCKRAKEKDLMSIPVCDMCNQNMQWGQGAGLTTTQVTTTEAYWEFMFTHQWAVAHQTDAAGGLLAGLVENQAAQDNTWLICDPCARVLGFDPEQYRKYSHKGSKPPGVGPAAEGKVALAAMFAWSELYDSWPTSIQIRATPPPSTGKVCDFCRRRMYPDEQMALMKPEAVEAFEKVGALRRRGSPSNVMEGTKLTLRVACPLCIARANQKIKTSS